MASQPDFAHLLPPFWADTIREVRARARHARAPADDGDDTTTPLA